jgi:hypothetical protein
MKRYEEDKRDFFLLHNNQATINQTERITHQTKTPSLYWPRTVSTDTKYHNDNGAITPNNIPIWDFKESAVDLYLGSGSCSIKYWLINGPLAYIYH